VSIEFAEFDQTSALSAQRELFEDAFPENIGLPAGSIEHYRWKFHSAPVAPPSFEFSAVENGRMLGYYAAIPYPYELAGTPVSAGMVCDVMTHSDARGKGLFTELGRYSMTKLEETDLAFVTGYPIRPEVMGGHLRVGWRVAFELPMYLRPLKADTILRSHRVAWMTPFANLGILVHRRLFSAGRVAEGYRLRVGEPRELLTTPAFKAFAEKWGRSITNHLVKRFEFYNWRLSAPGVSYRVFLVERDEEVVAAAVGRPAELQGIPSFALLDAMVVSQGVAALPMLYGAVEDEALASGAEAVVTMMSRYRARQYRLARFGFLKTPFVFKLIVRRLDGAAKPEDLAAERDWHLMWIDSDDL
jgi:hypothetical protein